MNCRSPFPILLGQCTVPTEIAPKKGPVMNLQPIEDRWKKLAERPDMIGRSFVYDNRVGSTKNEGTIGRIVVEGGYVTIESPELQQAHAQSANNSEWSPHIKFKIDEERDPHQVGDTIFCDLDDDRQIRILMQ